MDFNTGNSHKARHLCVLIHGLCGNPKNLEVMARSLRAKHSQEILHILVAKRNCGMLTYDGIELGGERVCQEIEEEIEKLAKNGQEIKRLSLVGYSLGGLVARYTIGLLYSKGFFERIRPVNFTSFASPHLGVRTPLIGFRNRMWNIMGARTLSASGRQLFGIDDFRDSGKPLLEVLGDPESIFVKGLAEFERRTLYANIINDKGAAYYTGAISTVNPFTEIDKVMTTYLEGYEDVILDPAAQVVPKEPGPVDLAFSECIARHLNSFVGRTSVALALAFIFPLGMTCFLINSGYQSVRSSRRIRRHENGLAGIKPSEYRVPLLIKEVQEAVEDAFENLNSFQETKFLAVDPEGDIHGDIARTSETNGPQSAGDPQPTLSHLNSETSASSQHVWPTLALTPYQFRIVETLDRLGWRKYPVHIHKLRPSHAAIIVRIQKPCYSEGYQVLRHWLDEEFII